ncbi:hypothetical protein FRC01_008463 [Tulasnella sp. 417]|nr:hypothetical protein FRC01_008463 [Tulasnella sp. 417]
MESNLEFTIRIRLNAVNQIPEVISVLPESHCNRGGANQARQQTKGVQVSEKPRPLTPEMSRGQTESGNEGGEDFDVGSGNGLPVHAKETGVHQETKFRGSEWSIEQGLPLPLKRSLTYDIRPFKFTATSAVVDFRFDWKVLVKILGGHPSPVLWLPAKQDAGQRQAYLRPSPGLNPFRPQTPGGHGFVIGSIQQELSTEGIDAKELPLFLTGSCASYAGTYTWQDVEPLSYREWTRQSETFKQKSIERFLTHKQRLVQIKVAKWKANGHWPSDAEVDEKTDYSAVSKRDIAMAIEAEALRIPLSAVRCIGYNYNYVRELIREAERRPAKGSVAALLDKGTTKLHVEPQEVQPDPPPQTNVMQVQSRRTTSEELNSQEEL